MDDFTELTKTLTKQISKSIKKQNGIFITPFSIIKILFENLPNINYKNILEPSCGTGQFLTFIDEKLNDVVLTGIELNEIIFNEIKKINFKNKINLLNCDYLTHKNIKYDLIIGNPPYVVCQKSIVCDNYKEFINGRPNLFWLFIIHSLFLLDENGICAFIIPKSFLNSSNYYIVRNFIIENYTLLKITYFEKNNTILETEQSTIGIIIQNKKQSELYHALKFNEKYICTCNLDLLKSLLINTTTLKNLNFKVKTGTIVWNQKKSILTNDNTKTLLIYNSNIVNNIMELKEFNNEEKKQYIDIEGNDTLIIVLNRGYGNTKYKLSYCLIEHNNYLVENHLNIIYSTEKLSKKKLLKKFNIILNSLKNEKTKLFIDLVFGNGGVSKTELETIFPIFI